jgi:WD40 repeat protein
VTKILNTTCLEIFVYGILIQIIVYHYGDTNQSWKAVRVNTIPTCGFSFANLLNIPTEIWRTVTDVKMSKDESLIYSASHDGSANIWKAGTGRLVSTLRKYIYIFSRKKKASANELRIRFSF